MCLKFQFVLWLSEMKFFMLFFQFLQAFAMLVP